MSDFEDDIEESDGSNFDASPSPAAKKAPAPKKAAVAAGPKKAAPAAKAKPAAAAPSKKKEKENDDDDEDEEARPKKVSVKPQTIEDQYQKLTQLQHVLKRPDTYIGSTQVHTNEMWVWNRAAEKMEWRSVSYPPGLYKIFDEILVNAADNAQRPTDVKMKNIKVTISQATGVITVWNDGQGIPIEMHQKEKMMVPELIFGELLTGANFNDNEIKVVGGRNGFGAKLANIFSTEFTLECVDSKRGKKYRQVWTDNMNEKTKGETTSTPLKSDYVEVKFKPDLSKFNVDSFSDDLMAVLEKRVLDIAGCNPTLNIYLNGKRVPVKSFKDYVNMYPLDTKEDGKSFALVYESPHERWEVAATVSTTGTFRHVSFVNSIATYEGGTHVNNVTDSITKALEEKFKTAKGAPITKAVVKQHLWIFMRCLIENPAFGSQTKEKLTSKVTEFGSKCKLSDEFMTKLAKGGIKEYVLRFANFKAQKSLKTKGGKKVDRLRGIEKLDDANFAGTKQGKDCTLIVTEGDSAKTLAVCGLSVVGRDYFGVFPLRGKPLNVRGCKVADLLKNKEITNLVKIIGLKYLHKYESVDSLRYGKLMIMADQDVDGSHIKGLVLNMIDVHWPELLKLGFAVEFITPIVKARKGKEVKSFYTLPEYEAWKASPSSKGWAIKYYKGLGTSERDEAREYFQDLKKHRIAFKYRGEMDHQSLELAFDKDKTEQRKTWINEADSKDFLRTATGSVTVSDFINKEMVHFSVESVHRAIPHVMDGMKPSHRKVLFGTFKRNLVKPIKVAQLAGYVSEKAAYHHGETSLQSTIIGMAQNFVGSNNINVLYPEGQFGSRLMGGDDASAARYIFTKLAPITRKIFHPSDDALLTYLEDDGYPVEPEFYVPIIPMLLVNGASGIGTGWSTKIPNYNPRDIVDNLRRLLRGDEMEPMHPWYMGFKGTIEQKDWSLKSTKNQYEVRGVYTVDGADVNISELPVQTWTQNYKDFIEENLVDAPAPKGCFFADYKEYHTDTNIDFNVTLNEEKIKEIESKGFEKTLKLVTSLSVNNFMAFGPDGKIKKYETVLEIMKDFYTTRLVYYGKRKEHLTAVLTEEWEILDNKVRFIESVITDEVKVRGKNKKAVNDELVRCGFKKFAAKKKKASAGAKEDDVDGDVEDFLNDDKEEAADSANYDYLLRMAIWTLTREKADALRKQRDDKRAELDVVLATHPKKMWSDDLDEFLVAYDQFETECVGASSGSESTRNLKTKSRTKAGAVAKKDSAPVAQAASAASVAASATAAAPAKKAAAAPAAAKPKAKAKAKAKADKDSGSFLDTSNYDMEDDDSACGLNDSDLELLNQDEDQLLQFSAEKAKKPSAASAVTVAAPKKAAVSAPAAAKKAAGKPKATKRAQDDELDEWDNDDEDIAPAKKKQSPPKKSEPAKKAEAPKAAPRRAAAAKKAVIIEDDEDEDDEMQLDDDDDDEVVSEESGYDDE